MFRSTFNVKKKKKVRLVESPKIPEQLSVPGQSKIWGGGF